MSAAIASALAFLLCAQALPASSLFTSTTTLSPSKTGANQNAVKVAVDPGQGLPLTGLLTPVQMDAIIEQLTAKQSSLGGEAQLAASNIMGTMQQDRSDPKVLDATLKSLIAGISPPAKAELFSALQGVSPTLDSIARSLFSTNLLTTVPTVPRLTSSTTTVPIIKVA